MFRVYKERDNRRHRRWIRHIIFFLITSKSADFWIRYKSKLFVFFYKKVLPISQNHVVQTNLPDKVRTTFLGLLKSLFSH